MPAMLGLGLMATGVLQGCASDQRIEVTQTVSPSVRAPSSIQRIVVLYPTTSSHDLRDAYTQLEAAVFKLKEERPSLRIVDRRHLPAIIREQQFQLRGMVSEDTAVHVGRVLGVDSVVIYHIEGPSLRDVVFARFSGDMPPIVISSKVVIVESAEVVFHNVVTTVVEPASDPLHTHVRTALERAIARTAADLLQAFR
jgi:hypothetical protein